MAAPDLDRDDMQGLLASGYGHLPEARYLLLQITDPALAGAWVGRLAGELTTAVGKSPGTAVNLALTASGLAKLGLPRKALEGFSAQLRDGMAEPDRSRALGDVEGDAPEHWSWGGPANPPVDVALLLYADDPGTMRALDRRLAGEPAGDGLELVRRLETSWSDREHFGFRDGIAQPAIEGLRTGRPDDMIKPGEVVLGYPNEYGLLTGRPLLSERADPGRILPRDPAGSGAGDLGRNGTYLVFRQLSQDVPAFWGFVHGAANGSNGGRPDARTRLAAQIVGRWPDGTPLVLAAEPPERAPEDPNDFRYVERDPDGVRCPIGAHIRRSHPRDMLDPRPGTERSIAVDRRHRILRRGRRYGDPISAEAALRGGEGADAPRGLHFICACANIARQFEFVQHTWVNNPKFAGLYDDPDPLIGPAGRSFTVQAEPVRRRLTGLPSFVGVRGGAYFFLPGIRATRYLAGLARA